jgi:hypothetical protein
MSRRCARYFVVTIVVILLGVSAKATPPSPIVSSVFAPIEGDIIEPGTSNTLHLTGEVHVLTQVAFSETGVPTVSIWANLVRVRGTSTATGITYLGVGAGNLSWVGTSPGPPDIPEQRFDLALVSLSVNPGPPDFPPSPVLPVYLRDFRFGAEDTNFGRLLTVEASFVSD